MIKKIKMYSAICDVCGADSNAGQEISAWDDIEQAKDIAAASGYIFNGDYCKCPECIYSSLSIPK